MKKNKKTTPKMKSETVGKRKRRDAMRILCWGLIPVAAAALIVLDALDIYTFSKERLWVLGILLVVVLLPFFSEVTVKNLTGKRGRPGSDGDTSDKGHRFGRQPDSIWILFYSVFRSSTAASTMRRPVSGSAEEPPQGVVS